MRLFIAIELPESWKAALAAAQNALRKDLGDGISWVAVDNLHLTLKFLGEIAEARVFSIAEALKSVTANFFSIELSNLGTLPPHGPTRVITAELAGDMEGLFTLQSSIETACECVDIPREARKFRPHITLGRVRRPRRIELASSDNFENRVSVNVTEIVLMQSIQARKGSTYIPLARFPLSE